MTTQEQYIERLKEMVAAKYGHAILTPEDCAALANVVHEATDGAIDAHSLELIFCAQSKSIAPRPVTLSTLARYVGYNGWSDFCSSREVVPAADADIIPTTRRWGVIILTFTAIAIVIAAALYLLFADPATNDRDISAAEREVYASVEERWCAIATEECIELRCNSDFANYNNRVEEVITENIATIERDVAAELEAQAKERGITIDPATIEEYKLQIIYRCTCIYDCLRNETTPL